jgi:hypothetical protein
VQGEFVRTMSACKDNECMVNREGERQVKNV